VHPNFVRCIHSRSDLEENFTDAITVYLPSGRCSVSSVPGQGILALT
jgi:hypothetical protein